MLFVSVSYQDYKNGPVSNQLTDIGRGECLLGAQSNELIN
jgi:hypothetical protein